MMIVLARLQMLCLFVACALSSLIVISLIFFRSPEEVFPGENWPSEDEIRCQPLPGCPWVPPARAETVHAEYDTRAFQYRDRADRTAIVGEALRQPASCDAALVKFDTARRFADLVSEAAEVVAASLRPPPRHQSVRKLPDWAYGVIIGWPRGEWTPPECASPAFPCFYFVSAARRPPPGSGGEAASGDALRVVRVARLPIGAYGVVWVEATAHPDAIARVRAAAAVVNGVAILPMGDQASGANLWHGLLHVVYPAWLTARTLPGTASLTAGRGCVDGRVAAAPRAADKPISRGEQLGCAGTATLVVPWWHDAGVGAWPSARGNGTVRQWLETVVGSFATVVDASAAASGGGTPLYIPFLSFARYNPWGLMPRGPAATAAVPALVALSTHVLRHVGVPERRQRGERPTVVVAQRVSAGLWPNARFLEVDHDDVRRRLAARGVEYLGSVVVGGLSAADQIRQWSRATVTISPHGAQAVSYLFSSRGGVWLEASIAGASRCWLRFHALAHGRGYAEFGTPAERAMPPPERNSEVSSKGIAVPAAVLVERVVGVLPLVADTGEGGDGMRERCARTQALLCVNG